MEAAPPPQAPENGNSATIQVSSLLSEPIPDPQTEPPAKKLKVEESPEVQVAPVSEPPQTLAPAVTQPIRHNEPPVHEMVGGSSVRQYLNKHLTKHLLEGLKLTARNKPEDPLRELGEFLIERSKQLKAESDNSG